MTIKDDTFTKMMFAPGCALMLYKQQLAEKLFILLNEKLGKIELLETCCKHDPQLTGETLIINICPGCNKRFANDYKDSSTISLWEILAKNDIIAFPDYHEQIMTILDACPTREQEKVQTAIRTVLQKMNITVVEPKNTRTKSNCCGDSFYGLIPTEKVKEQMIKRTAEMPVKEVVVYCISCIKSIYIGGKKPHHLLDLLFGEETQPQTYEPDEWHKELDIYIEQH